MALLWSAIVAGLSISASLMAKGIFQVHLEGVPGAFLLENLGYTFGSVIVIMARQQLFTENTVTAVLPGDAQTHQRQFYVAAAAVERGTDR